jgi:DHA1 family bicyclomycin/chloramphenicol resistance-like MFS transporter
MAVVGLFTDGRPLPMVTGMAGGALIAVVLTWLTLDGRRQAACQAG